MELSTYCCKETLGWPSLLPVLHVTVGYTPHSCMTTESAQLWWEIFTNLKWHFLFNIFVSSMLPPSTSCSILIVVQSKLKLPVFLPQIYTSENVDAHCHILFFYYHNSVFLSSQNWISEVIKECLLFSFYWLFILYTENISWPYVYYWVNLPVPLGLKAYFLSK